MGVRWPNSCILKKMYGKTRIEQVRKVKIDLFIPEKYSKYRQATPPIKKVSNLDNIINPKKTPIAALLL
jgi:hypothetical protein